MSTIRQTSVAVSISVLLTLLFWGPLWGGSGFIGGDLYPYFFPQKAFLADRLHAGEFPLWNNLTGFGYPVLGESQTGAAYPPYLLAYCCLDVNMAYNVEHLLHYMICFFGTWLFGRRIGLGVGGSILTATVFTYGWFPPRACLEWAIVTGAWLPVALWCVESFVQTRWWRYAIGLSFVLGLQLLAGHFHLAFITQLLVVAYSARRAATVQNCVLEGRANSPESPQFRFQLFLPILLCVMAGFLIAAVQLVPAWELKTRSSRATVGADHEPSYGHLPPLYASQIVAPWLWYSPQQIRGEEQIRTVAELASPWHWFGPDRDLDESLMQSRAGGLTTIATNKVEAHLYCGLVPLALAIWWLIAGQRQMVSAFPGGSERLLPTSKSSRGERSARVYEPPTGGLTPPRSERRSRTQSASVDEPPETPVHFRGESWFWVIAGGLALVYATGWLLPVARFIPGFNFFRGPGRYGIVTTLAVAILAGRGLSLLLAHRAGFGRIAILGCVMWSTVGDLWQVSRMVTYAVMVPHPAITLRDQSPVRKLLLAETQAPRLYAPGQNLGNLLGVSCLPVYLGIAPAEYSDPKFAGSGMPKPDDSLQPMPANADFSNWLRECGVTHILTFKPIDETAWQADQVWQGIDPMLTSAWGRYDPSGHPEPLFLYKLQGSPGRASVLANGRHAENSGVTVTSHQESNRFVVELHSSQEATVLVRELQYPGWTVEIDGRPATAVGSGTFREVQVPAGIHQITWSYRPFSVKLGLGITVLTVLLLAAIGHVRFWHPAWLSTLLGRARLQPALRDVGEITDKTH